MHSFGESRFGDVLKDPKASEYVTNIFVRACCAEMHAHSISQYLDFFAAPVASGSVFLRRHQFARPTVLSRLFRHVRAFGLQGTVYNLRPMASNLLAVDRQFAYVCI